MTVRAAGVGPSAPNSFHVAKWLGDDARHRWAYVAFGTAFLLALALILLTNGIWPGMLNSESVGYLTVGAIRCEHALGFHALLHRCHAFGNPGGYGLLTNGPLLLFGGFLAGIPGVSAETAAGLANGCVVTVALAGGYGLARRLGAARAISLWAITLYLISPTLLGMNGFPGTYGGFQLLPFYALADVLLLRQIEQGGRKLALAVIAYTLVRTGALFMDGYSFVISTLVTACIWLTWAWKTGKGNRIWLAGGMMLVANVIAYGVYDAYIPGIYPANPPGIFRSMGLDLVTLVRPTDFEWFTHIGGFAWNPSHLWGDGTNARFNYIGFASIILAVLGFALARHSPATVPAAKPADTSNRRLALALALAGTVAFILSLGPALKINSRKAVANTGTGVTYQSYLMPQKQAVVEFPWDSLFWKLPGLKSMRATYRWFAVTRLALLMLAGIGLQQLLSRRRWWALLAVLLGIIATIELIPNFSAQLAAYRAGQSQLRAASNAVGGELRALTKRGQHVFFLNYEGENNDFMVNYFAPAAKLYAFNAGGDKDSYFAMLAWPSDLLALARPRPTPTAVYRALKAGVVDAVLVPFFDLRWSAYSWPPTPGLRAAIEKYFAPLLNGRRLKVKRMHWLAVVTLPERPSGSVQGNP